MVEPLKRRNSQSVPAFETDTKLDRNINMRKLKVFYFFTEESESYEEIMKTFLMNAKLEIKFSKEVINHATLASGSSITDKTVLDKSFENEDTQAKD